MDENHIDSRMQPIYSGNYKKNEKLLQSHNDTDYQSNHCLSTFSIEFEERNSVKIIKIQAIPVIAKSHGDTLLLW